GGARAVVRAVLHNKTEWDRVGHGDCTKDRRGPRRPHRGRSGAGGGNRHYSSKGIFMNRSLRIAVADDEARMLEFYQALLPLLGHTVVCAALDGRELLEQCRAQRPDLIITDIKMPHLDGIDAARGVCQDDMTPVILVSAFSDAELIERAGANYVM